MFMILLKDLPGSAEKSIAFVIASIDKEYGGAPNNAG